MSDRDQQTSHAGDPRHPQHDQWLLELGRATYAASKVAGICFDLARVLGGVDSASMYCDPMGKLVDRLRPLAKKGTVPGLEKFVSLAESARDDRNDLVHALPVQSGLHRRKSGDLGYVRNFFEVDQLAAVTRSLTEVALAGNQLLYQDDGAAVAAWYAKSSQ